MNPEAPQQRQLTKNRRCISRFLTRPWQSKQGALFYFDFDTDSFGWSSGQSLFADDQRNTPQVKSWLAETIERPLSAIRPRLSSGDATVLDDRSFFRAAVLMLWLQGNQFPSTVDDDVRQDMNGLAALSGAALDELVGAVSEDMALRLVFTSSDDSIAPIFVPATGIFSFTYPDTGCVSGQSIGVALPLDVQCALVFLPADKGSDADLSLLRPSLSNFSIGASESRRVVLPPNLLGTMAESEAARILKEQREQSESLVSDVRDVRRLVLQVFAEVGVHPRVDRTGRIIHP